MYQTPCLSPTCLPSAHDVIIIKPDREDGIMNEVITKGREDIMGVDVTSEHVEVLKGVKGWG